jgi:DNA-binding IscR family transcriptional regulator
VTSARGAAGGYTLSRPPEQITAGEALTVLGGRLFESDFCNRHTGAESLCTHSIDCSIRSLWQALQSAVDNVLTRTTLKDLLCSEPEMVLLMSDRARTSSSVQLGIEGR